MMKRLYAWGPVVLLLAFGLATVNIHFNADIFSLLPAHSPTVQGLKRYQREFGSSQEVIVAITGFSSESIHSGAEQIAQLLQENQLSDQVVWQSPFREDVTALGELLAYLWINESPRDFNTLLERFDPNRLTAQLEDVLERMATSFNAEEVGRLAYDPLGFLTVADRLAAHENGDLFVSENGLFRILYARYPGDSPGYWQYRRWLAKIKSTVTQAQEQGQLSPELVVRYTGIPAFVDDFGSRMLKDLIMAAVTTMIMVMVLFWWAHRRWRPMAWLATLLVSALALTVLAGAVLFGSLSTISLGFAAILLGLAADYGLIVYQEYRTHPERSTSELRRLLAPSILWAAATTAGAFLMVARSSLPGLTQLGVLVAVGILVVTVLVLTAFIASIKKSVVSDSMQQDRCGSGGFKILTTKVPVWPATVGLTVGSLLVVLFVTPTIETNVESLQFKDITAQHVHDDVNANIQAKVQGSEHDFWVIISGKSEDEVKEGLARVKQGVETAQQGGVSLMAKLPDALWPDIVAQQQNCPILSQVLSERERIGQQLSDAGFDIDAMTLADSVFDTWQVYRERSESADGLSAALWPQSDSGRWLFGQFASPFGEEVLALGLLAFDSTTAKSQMVELVDELNGFDGVQVVSWSLLADSLAETMIGDARNVILPMVIVLVVLLGLAFRDVRDMALSFMTLIFTLLCLTAVMALLGWSWNLMNMTALPLLLGAGVDYSIHIQLALKRYQGNTVDVYRSVGSAILLCGASTAAAFTSLGFASNPGVASLGRVAALGIVIANGTALFLLPGWWHTMRRQKVGLVVVKSPKSTAGKE
ncbi:MMPL family transporter [Planctomycetota bacterium]